LEPIIHHEEEQWQEHRFPGHLRIRNKYLVSSSGRVISFRQGTDIDGQELKGANNHGYLTINLRGKGKTVFIHRLVATLFLPRPSPDHKYVIHLNHCKQDNAVINLRWVTLKELQAHRRQSPGIVALREHRLRTKGAGAKKMGMKKMERLQFEQRVMVIRRIASVIEQY
jgi:hypothetical protein